MEFNYRAIDEKASMHLPPSSSFSLFTQPALRAGYSNAEFGRGHELFRNPNDLRELVQRELEKERIREEIIAAEITRRRILEVEVRTEMLMEREMALRSAEMRFEPRLSNLPQSEGRSLEERLAVSLEERLGYSARRGVGGLEPLPFQRNVEPKISDILLFQRNVEPKISNMLPFQRSVSEVRPLLEVSKENVILQAKPDGNLSGAKRKAVTPPAGGTSELPSVSLKKKIKEEWSCALCQVSATSERGLNAHLQGKKHKAREAGLRAKMTGRNIRIGLFPKKSSKSAKVGEFTDNPSSEHGGKIEGESLLVSKDEEASLKRVLNAQSLQKNDKPLLQLNLDADVSMKKNGEAVQKNQKTAGSKKKFRFWCEMCQVGACSEKVMATHKNGKKHVARLQKHNQNGGAIPSIQLIGATQKANDMEGVVTDGKMEACVNVGRTVDGVEVEDHQAGPEIAGNDSD